MGPPPIGMGSGGILPTLLSHVNVWEHDERVNKSGAVMEKLQLGPGLQNPPSRKIRLTFTCTKEERFIYLSSSILMRFDVMQRGPRPPRERSGLQITRV